MALFAFYHTGRLVGTYLLVKAENSELARKKAAEELKHPIYLPQDLTKLFWFELDGDDSQEEMYEKLLQRVNVKIIQNYGLTQEHRRSEKIRFG